METWKPTGIVIAGTTPDDDLRILCPWVLPLSDGLFRAYYMGYGTGSPPGTTGRILSALSDDGITFVKEPGVRVDHYAGAELRVLSPSVLAVAGGYRMYFEARGHGGSFIGSAFSPDGLEFALEPGPRIAADGTALGSPRPLVLPDGAVRLYFHTYPQPFRMGIDRGNHVVSAVAVDGLTFEREEGVRLPQTVEELELHAVYCAHPVSLGGPRVRAFYGVWRDGKIGRGAIMTALSEDGGLSFVKSDVPCVVPEGESAGFASEPCVYRDREGRHRMVYEAEDAEGATAILGAVAV